MSTPKSKITANAIVWIAKILLAIFTMTSITIGTNNESHTVVILMVLVAVCGVVFGYPLIYMVESHVGTVTFVFACIVVIITFFANHVSSETVKILLKSLGAFIYFFGYLTTRIEEE